ncbi:sigma-54-dependent transcriptional regulator [Parachryseolinea silvisoli]|uniref:sigma-54-dependent transcriptional regulator n=1 Tax=Parachryseolinea silvisoli TaxID=2873601 RepID=UPI0022658E83|nr:sigma-54 dependent transcriptional regulator [Parachryseolinea silvisoli]MCD9017683.1 sigma-54 dependent transcriptional regulator [Parachryseolinea silvisoli]
MKGRILIVEDQFVEANSLRLILEKAAYQVCSLARSVDEALKILDHEKPDLVLVDILLSGALTGLDLAAVLQQKGVAFIFLSANSNADVLEKAKSTHPYGFLVKPFREKDVLVALEIAQYMHKHGVRQVVRKEAGKRAATAPFTSKIVGNSPRLKETLEYLGIVAPTETSVLIYGESGTGKELIVDAIHAMSPRHGKPLVKVNCGALPSTLIESTLFGHEKGSFTGASERHIGKFEQASGGTIFLDEVGEMPFELQVKLLRVLQEREIERIGSRSTIKVDIRVIAASNKDLGKEVAAGRFRMDLFYRLNVFPLHMPPLRERREDIPLLAEYFVKQYSPNRENIRFSPQLMNQLMDYEWPGNVRQLEHYVQRASLLSRGDVIENVPLPWTFDLPAAATTTRSGKTIEENERDHILATLIKCKHRVSGPGGAAEILDIPATTLHSRIKKLGIKRITRGGKREFS